MADEIKISEFELDDCSNDLLQLLALWNGVPTVPSDPFDESSGESAGSFSTSMDAAKQVYGSMKTMLDASVRFFKKANIQYQFSDQTSADQIDTLTI